MSFYVCKVCATRAVANPENEEEWGCRECGTRTLEVSIHFREIKPVVPTDN